MAEVSREKIKSTGIIFPLLTFVSSAHLCECLFLTHFGA